MKRQWRRAAIATGLLLVGACVSQHAHREITDTHPGISQVATLEPTPSYSGYVVEYASDALRVHALVAIPDQPMPKHGYPVLIVNHGYHPNPPEYGFANGRNDRPGDYYRDIPRQFAQAGYLVLMADYRGHNTSEGYAFTQREDATRYYARDVLALIQHLDDIQQADTRNVFMWGHSMGGAVSLRVLLDNTPVRAASLWASAPRDALLADIGSISTPILLQHARQDHAVPYARSEAIVAALSSRDDVTLLAYDSTAHLFRDQHYQRALVADLQFFQQFRID
ncbi:MAG: alpha/beta fold hydrolase [Pseudomonadota bacterium]